ncbi:MAG TPA: carboxyltransferase domain-containing protein [Gemmataceae bacterium]|nr:carboxyltransferase domain-containing protein [Gemmataceae bacterium]
MSTLTALLPLGDQAVLAYFADESAALRFAATVRRDGTPWLVDVVQAYASVGVFFDPDHCDFRAAADRLRGLADLADHAAEPTGGRLHVIACCYEMGPDLARVAEQTGLSTDEVIRRHAATEYVVYAIGFCPGFPYLGYLPPELCGVPRLAAPRLRVEAGSVGLTGRQTGIYTEARPGGWNLVGRTPLVLVDVADGYFPLRTGDRVRFARIDEAEYRRLAGERL